MRVSVIFLVYLVFFPGSTSAQGWYAPMLPGSGSFAAGTGGRSHLEQRGIVVGSREASALLAIMLQGATADPDDLVRSALHFQAAISAGCSDLDRLATHAIARLSPEQRVSYDEMLPRWLAPSELEPDPRLRGPCLQW